MNPDYDTRHCELIHMYAVQSGSSRSKKHSF